jgi:hypothetical protein
MLGQMQPSALPAPIGLRALALWLIRQGAELNLHNSSGYAPIHLAADLRDLDLLKTLVAAGADVHALKIHGRTPASAQPQSEANALSIAARHLIPWSQTYGPTLEVVNFLLQQGCRLPDGLIFARTQNYQHPLVFAFNTRHLALARQVLERMAPRSQEAQQMIDHCLLEAGMDGQEQAAALLIEFEANVHHQVPMPDATIRPIELYLEEQFLGTSAKVVQLILAARARQALSAALQQIPAKAPQP